MRILLINPSRMSEVEADLLPSYPLGLLYIAAVLRNIGHHLGVLDLGLLELNDSMIKKKIQEFKPDLIGITSVSNFFEELKRICNLSKGYKIVLGGIHPTFLPEFTFKHTNADFIVMGEGEETMVELVDYLENGGEISKIKGLAYKNNEEVIINERRALIKDLDTIPFPAWDLLNFNPSNKLGYKTFHNYEFYLPLVTTRGCPYKCTFCASTNFWGPSIRFRSVKNVVDEIEQDIKNYNVKNFEIWDDNFTINRKRTIDFCREILKRKIKVSFFNPNGVRIDSLDPLLIKFLKAAGFKGIVLAPESGSQKIIDGVKKKLDLSVVKKVAKMLQKERILTSASFILGLPGETHETAYQTIRFGASLPLNGITYFIYTPLPGSELFNKWCKNVNLDEMIWNTNYMGHQSYKEKVIGNLSLKELEKMRSLGYIFYMVKFKNILRLLRRFNIHMIKPLIFSVSRTYISLFKNVILKL